MRMRIRYLAIDGDPDPCSGVHRALRCTASFNGFDIEWVRNPLQVQKLIFAGKLVSVLESQLAT